MSEKHIPETLVLKDTHPTIVKFHKLMDFADELGLTIEFGNYSVNLYDRDRDASLPPLQISDIEGRDNVIRDFPPALDFYVWYQNPLFLKQEEEKRAEQQRIYKEQQEAQQRKLAEEHAQRKEQARIEIEQRERAQLAHLKQKYEGIDNE